MTHYDLILRHVAIALAILVAAGYLGPYVEALLK